MIGRERHPLSAIHTSSGISASEVLRRKLEGIVGVARRSPKLVSQDPADTDFRSSVELYLLDLCANALRSVLQAVSIPARRRWVLKPLVDPGE